MSERREHMFFQRKAMKKLSEWKEKYADSYALLLEGARRVGKSTIAEEFAASEYESYVLIDFANTSDAVRSSFDDIHDLDLFFLRLQALTGVTLIEKKSVIIFDEIQLFPKARQAIKYLVKDGRYHYIETGSLISIKKNVQDIVIPSEEMKVQVHPMDFEEFCWATNTNTFSMIQEFYEKKVSIGADLHRKWMKEFRLYMGVGGMPQAVRAYVDGKNFSEIDMVKRTIIELYEDDFRKLDATGNMSSMFHSIPAQLSKDAKKYSISDAIDKRKAAKDEERLADLVDSRTVNICYNTTSVQVSLSQTKDLSSYKVYLSDIGLFMTLLFIDQPVTENEIYTKLLSDKLPANLGYLYENVVAQMLRASGRELYYHTWEKEGSTHYYEVDFLFTDREKISCVEVKSSGLGKFESIRTFRKKYSQFVRNSYLFSQKDRTIRDETAKDIAAKDRSKKTTGDNPEDGIQFMPIYMAPLVFEPR